MFNRFFRSVENSGDAANIGKVIGGCSAAIAAIVFFTALDRAIHAQNDSSDGMTRGILSFIVGPIVTYYSANYGATLGGLLAAIGWIGYDMANHIAYKH